MPTLILARHAKAEAPAAGLSDMDRALAVIGRKASVNLGEALVEASLTPDVALVSPANRTQQTWKLMATALPECETRIVDAIYETHVPGLLRELNTLDVDGVVVVVGHEPTSSAAAAFLSGSGSDKTALQRVAHGLPTGTAAVLEFDCSWAELGARTARLTAIVSGRDL
ncbi:SixA phosphatase family protein [Demequina zhanjiangensis]|uniref:Histidine phosphatase family protein n=1 Tax=Demequina zhanjiangensis TaxID=3051659 RepID=A0ABT8G1Z5_9MICO|nr:histidine phosphatase family protein [Demequina sp. SYSU T00b26]MDN4473097.1 histidine phosphatase family protein [Demequina sp. SYSU T00b26]